MRGVHQDTAVTVHDRDLITKTITTATPVQSAKAGKRAKMITHDKGTLTKQNVTKLDTTVCQLAEAAGTMEKQLIHAAANAQLISPLLISQLTAVKCGMDAELAAIQMYKENNREDDTVNVVKAAKTKLNEARNQFKVMEKMLNVTNWRRNPTDSP